MAQRINFQTNASKISNSPAQVQTVNTCENLLNEIIQIIRSLYQVIKLFSKVYNNIMNSIKV